MCLVHAVLRPWATPGGDCDSMQLPGCCMAQLVLYTLNASPSLLSCDHLHDGLFASACAVSRQARTLSRHLVQLVRLRFIVFRVSVLPVSPKGVLTLCGAQPVRRFTCMLGRHVETSTECLSTPTKHSCSGFVASTWPKQTVARVEGHPAFSKAVKNQSGIMIVFKMR